MSFKKMLLSTKLSDEKIIETFLPYLINDIEFDDRKDNDITLYFIIDTQDISKECLIKIINMMLNNNKINKKEIEYIINNYKKYNLSYNDFYKLS